MSSCEGESHDIVHDDEDEPYVMLNFVDSDEQLRVDRNTATLYTYLGRLSLHDHIFVLTQSYEADAVRVLGMHIWNEMPGFDELADFMIANECPAVLNMPSVTEFDQEARAESLSDDIDEDEVTVPEEWLDMAAVTEGDHDAQVAALSTDIQKDEVLVPEAWL